jgi:type II secretory pathway pseudopilin PulG
MEILVVVAVVAVLLVAPRYVRTKAKARRSRRH